MTQSAFTCPHAGHTIKDRAVDPSLPGRVVGKHAKQFGLKKARLQAACGEAPPPPCQKKEFSSLGMGNRSIARN